MADQVETLISEAERVIEQLGEKKTKNISELKAELDRMVAASKEPGYSLDDRETLLKKRALVIDAMETALHTVMGEGLESMTSANRTDAPTDSTTSVETPTQSAFVPESTTPAPAPSTTTEPKNVWQKFLENAGGFFSSVGTYFTNLWNSWFGKKEGATESEVKTETTTAAATTTTPETTAPEAPTPTTENVPNPATQKAYDEDPTVPGPTTISPENQTPAPLPATDPLTPEAPAEALPAIETVNLMDGAAHEVAEHQFLWTGKADNLFRIDGRKFGVDLVTMAGLGAASPKIEKVGDNVIIRTGFGDKELNPVQIASLMNQALNTPPLTKPAVTLFGRELKAAYQYIPIKIEYSSLSGTGATLTRTPGFKELELLPQS